MELEEELSSKTVFFLTPTSESHSNVCCYYRRTRSLSACLSASACISLCSACRLTLVNMGGADTAASPPYSDATGLCIWRTTETAQIRLCSCYRALTMFVSFVCALCGLGGLLAGVAETGPGPGRSDEGGCRGFWVTMSGLSGTWKSSSSGL